MFAIPPMSIYYKDINMNDFSIQLKKIMDFFHLDQVQLAKKTKMTQAYISHILTGKRKSIGLDNLKKLSTGLGISLSQVIGEVPLDKPEKPELEITAEALDIIELLQTLPEDDWIRKALDEKLNNIKREK